MAHEGASGPLAEIELSVPSMVRDGCAERIGNALRDIPSVQSVKAKLRRKRIRVRYDSSLVQATLIKDALAAAGFQAVNV